MTMQAKVDILKKCAMFAGSAALLLAVGFLIGWWSSTREPDSTSAHPSSQTVVSSRWSCEWHDIIKEKEPGQCPVCDLPLMEIEVADIGPATQPAAANTGAAHGETWTCAMHPQFQLPEFGACPLCGMDLIPVEPVATDVGPRTLTMSANDRALARIVTTPAVRRHVTTELRLAGKVALDETRVKAISAWMGGRVDRLFVDYTGISVRKGEHLALLYSPQLLTAQQELIEARRWVDDAAPEPSEFLREASRRTLDSAREKLRLLGLGEKQVREIEERGTADDHVLITTPAAGIVVHKAVAEGDYVQTGTHLYSVADLSSLWVQLDAYESDLAWISLGQRVMVDAEALPGETFEGTIAFIDPLLNAGTRTVKVRVNVPNLEGRLKPGMFVRAVVHAGISHGGTASAPDRGGKWTCPMHLGVVRDHAGPCDICGMPLERIAHARRGGSAEDHRHPLVIPATAVLRTGRRAVVYVEDVEAELPTYEGREVVLGPRAGESYIVLEGLQAGEHVVVQGNFKIDSALQIQAKPSMMNPAGGAKADPHAGH